MGAKFDQDLQIAKNDPCLIGGGAGQQESLGIRGGAARPGMTLNSVP